MTTPVPPLIPGDTVLATNRISTVYPDQVYGPYTSWKEVVVAVATTNIAALSGLQVVDTVQLVEGDRILLTAQTGGIANGIYIAKANAWGRANDLQPGSSASGLAVLVNNGSVPNADSVYICTNVEGSDVVGVNQLVFVQLVGLGTTVSGPGVSTNTAIPTWNGTTGTKLNNSTVLLSAGGAITGATSFTASGAITSTGGTVQGVTLTDGTFSTTGGVVTGATIIAASDNVAANSLKTTGAVVDVAAAAPPVTSQVLTASSATTSTWQYPATDFLNTGTSLGTVAGKVNVSDSTAPASTYVLIATSATAATWQPQSALTGVPAPIALGFGMFYGLTAGTGNGGPTDYAGTIAVKTSAGTGRVPFPRLGSASASNAPTLLGDNASVNLPGIGTYMVTFNVHTTEPGQLQLELNGTDLAYTCAANMNPTSGGHPIGGTFFVTTVSTNSVLAVINPAGNSTALTVTPANGSDTHANTQSIVVTRIA